MLLETITRFDSINIFNNTFFIRYIGHFGTINGFKLGRLPSQQVEWSEINCGLGQVTLLMHSIANFKSIKFSKFELNPNGSNPIILISGKAYVLFNFNKLKELFGGQGSFLY